MKTVVKVIRSDFGRAMDFSTQIGKAASTGGGQPVDIENRLERIDEALDVADGQLVEMETKQRLDANLLQNIIMNCHRHILDLRGLMFLLNHTMPDIENRADIVHDMAALVLDAVDQEEHADKLLGICFQSSDNELLEAVRTVYKQDTCASRGDFGDCCGDADDDEEWDCYSVHVQMPAEVAVNGEELSATDELSPVPHLCKDGVLTLFLAGDNELTINGASTLFQDSCPEDLDEADYHSASIYAEVRLPAVLELNGEDVLEGYPGARAAVLELDENDALMVNGAAVSVCPC